MTKKIRHSEACVTWLQWIQLVLCRTLYSFAMRLLHGSIRQVICMPWFRRFCMVSKRRLETKTGDASLINSRPICPIVWQTCTIFERRPQSRQTTTPSTEMEWMNMERKTNRKYVYAFFLCEIRNNDENKREKNNTLILITYTKKFAKNQIIQCQVLKCYLKTD